MLRLFSALCLTFLASYCHAKKNRDLPHSHQGLLKAYQPGPFPLTLSADDETVLSSGKPVMKEEKNAKGSKASAGGAICVQDVHAPKPAVWNQILRLDDYKGKVNKVLENKNYFVTKNEDGSITMKTKQRISVIPGYSYENYYDHSFYPNDDSMVWSLDYEKTSDFDDVSGHWHVANHPKRDGWTRVFYACDIKMRSSPPGPVMSFISKSALKAATSWVKRESEKEPDNTYPSGFEPTEVESAEASATPEKEPAGGRRFGRFGGPKPASE